MLRARRIAAALLLAAAALLGVPTTSAAQRPIEERRAAPANGPIRIHQYGGSLHIVGSSSDSIVVTGTVHEIGGDRFYISATAQGSKLGIWPQQADTLPPSHLEIRVPRNSSVWIKTVSAEVRVSDVTGGVDVYSVSGTIDVTGSPRELFAETMAGDVRADVATRSARLRTASGAITVRGRIADAAAQSVSGAVRVTGDDIERGRFESVDGDVEFTGTVRRSAELEFINHSGGVHLRLPAATDADVLISTYGGAFRNAFPVRATEAANRFKGRELGFVLGTGGARVVVRTFDGEIVLEAF